MLKKTISFFVAAIVLLSSTSVFADNAAKSLISGEAQYIVLATITNISDNTFELTKGYGIKLPENGKLADAFSVKKFKYGYCIEHADNYNNPQMGDNIIAAINYANGAYTVSEAFMVDNVSSSAKVKVPEELKYQPECLEELLALGYFIHSDGERTKYEYTDTAVYAIVNGGEKFEINSHSDDYVVFFSKNKPNLSDKPTKPTDMPNVSNTAVMFLACGVAFGILCVVSINYIINRRED